MCVSWSLAKLAAASSRSSSVPVNPSSFSCWVAASNIIWYCGVSCNNPLSNATSIRFCISLVAAPPASSVFSAALAASPAPGDPIALPATINPMSNISLGSSPAIIPSAPSNPPGNPPKITLLTSPNELTAPAVSSILSLNAWSVFPSSHDCHLSKTNSSYTLSPVTGSTSLVAIVLRSKRLLPTSEVGSIKLKTSSITFAPPLVTALAVSTAPAAICQDKSCNMLFSLYGLSSPVSWSNNNPSSRPPSTHLSCTSANSGERSPSGPTDISTLSYQPGGCIILSPGPSIWGGVCPVIW